MDYPNFEILAINDGSSARTAENFGGFGDADSANASCAELAARAGINREDCERGEEIQSQTYALMTMGASLVLRTGFEEMIRKRVAGAASATEVSGL